ncbi:cystathionine gamma-synthase [Xanthomonas oryzae pv. oryzae]|nr:cystathionine gamma-synthase [Xanthomonas oryzae pv. oryzae]
MQTTTNRSGPELLENLYENIRKSYPALSRKLVKTPLVELPWLGANNRRVWAKLECMQRTGSFKLRGAYNSLRLLAPGAFVYTASAGNHGLAIATLARELGLHANIFVPLNASEIKIRRLRAVGARIVQGGADVSEAYVAAHQEAQENGRHYISPFDHPDVVAGQGSLALEIAEQDDRRFDHILLPFGGGGLLTGFGCAAAKLWPETRLHGAHPAIFGRNLHNGFDGQQMLKSVMPTLADGLAIEHEPYNWLWPLIQALAPIFHAVPEDRIKTSMMTLLHQESILSEGAGAIALAPLLFDESPNLKGDILVLVSGGNISVPLLAKAMTAVIEEPRLRKINGLRASTLGIELSASASAPGKTSQAAEKTSAYSPSPISKATLLSMWLQLVDRVEQGLDKLQATLQQHLSFTLRESLPVDPIVESFMGDALDSTRKMISSCRSPGLDGRQVAQRYRLLIQSFGLARSALNWCSASTDQSKEIMFFDPADLQTSSVNYERYGSVALRELELNLVHAIGFGGGAHTALLTSSGQAAYSTLESYLLREVFPKQPDVARVARVPYLYFEALEQLEALPQVSMTIAEDWSVEALIECVEHTDSHVVFADPMANIGELPCFDFQALANALRTRDWRNRWLVIDGTMISGGFNPFTLFDAPHHPQILYFESGSKYLQLGLDLQMLGVVVCSEQHAPSLARHRRNLGTGLNQNQVARFPLFGREQLLQRMQRLTRNAEYIAASLDAIEHPCSKLRVAYPRDWRQRQWNHGGGVVAITFSEPGLNNRHCLEGLIELIINSCRTAGVSITKGVSFGFGVTRISAAAAMAESTDPFLRFSMGEETSEQLEQLEQLVACVTQSIYTFLETFG